MNAPIGVFDSGLGGLTVVRRLLEQLPGEQIVYVADQAHVPYGGRKLTEVCGFACSISAALLHQGCRAVVMACNISSATALPAVQMAHPDLPVLGVILPGAQAAAARTRHGRIGVLATEGTVRSGAYTRTLHAIDPALEVTEVACPAFVPLVEAGREASPEAKRTAAEYLLPLIDASVDTIVLGCTHYPFLTSVLQDLQPEMEFVDPAEHTAVALKEALHRAAQIGFSLSRTATLLPHLFYTTGDPACFAVAARHFLPHEVATAVVAQAHWHEGKLTLPAPAR